MTIYDEALNLLRSLKSETRWEAISLREGLEYLEDPDLEGMDVFREIMGRDDFEYSPSNPVGTMYRDIVHEAWEKEGLMPVRKSIYIGPQSEVLCDLVRIFGNPGISHDPKRKYHTFILEEDEEQLGIAAISQEVANEAIDKRMREIALESDNIRKNWRVVREDGIAYYERSCHDDPENRLVGIIDASLKDANISHLLARGYLDKEGKFFKKEESYDDLNFEEFARLLDPDTRKGYLKEIKQKDEEQEKLETEILKDASSVVRIQKTLETTTLLKDQLGVSFSRAR